MNKDMENIVLIGPVYPYKGGISHYTGLMYRALSDKYKVTMVSYKFQYPKLLYKKEQRDYENDSFKIEDTNYWIHTANPVNWFTAANKIKKLNPDLVIIQWWHPYFAPCYWSMAKALGALKILFVCHNVFPHERFPMDKLLTRMVLKQGNYFIVQSGKDAEDLKGIMPDARYEQTVHPTYNAFKFENLSKEKSRELLGKSMHEKILLFFGFVREYKGLRYLIEAMPEISRRIADVKLMIVGDFGSEENKETYVSLIKEKNVEKFIDICDGYIPDRDIEKFLLHVIWWFCLMLMQHRVGLYRLRMGLRSLWWLPTWEDCRMWLRMGRLGMWWKKKIQSSWQRQSEIILMKRKKKNLLQM